MDEEKNVKAIDAIYKNILEKFNPESKRMLMNAKTYLKALQNSSQASKLFGESLTKLAENAQSTPGATDIGSALTKIIDVFKSIEEQHQQILKVIYVDFICPLETNLAKDVKVIQAEQKKFSHQLKMRTDSFDKATAAVKKHRKKKNNAERELKCIQVLEEEKKNLDNFMQRESNNALLQERRRYGFILERYTESIAKHYLHFFNNSFESINSNIQRWNEIAATREMINISPMSAEGTLSRKNNGETLTMAMKRDNENFNSRRNLERASLSLSEESESNLSINNKNDAESIRPPQHYSMDKIAASPNNRIVVAMYGYSATQENQLSFAEGDKICLIGDNISGWRFGENVKTKTFGWFPSSYIDGNHSKTNGTTKENEMMNEGTFGNTMSSRYHSISKQRNFQNPPAVRAPSPPAQDNEMNAKKSLRGIYSSNDSGFDNEIPPIAPEVDYSDDDDDDDDHMPHKVPIRKPNSSSDGFLGSAQSNSHGDLTENITTMKRNKAFWRFSKSEDLLEGMGMWKHRDLLPIENVDESTLKKSVNYKKSVEKNMINPEVYHQRMPKEKTHEENFDDIYDETPKRRNHTGPATMNENSFYKELQDTNFYDDDDDDVLVRTVKRKEILKQYHSSETDTELSISSDPYVDCVLQKTTNNTLLPRTKLLKARNESYDHGLESSSNKTKAFHKSWHN